ncbi:hypothetical protein KDK_34950 [Dictyobacter kobayashii]|uniref:Uncharacterized protein n=1 Tax=Dictyobacter kobayashii TaxID=2014872 RepID=A0A402AKY8_9CHLR|nr:hypothetical protein KDK_34950 [Dictyobacter kobayashii]
MKVGSVSSQLYLINAQQNDRTHKFARGRSLSWVDQVVRVAQMVVILWPAGVMQSTLEEYSLRVDELQACIHIGAYNVDSVALARCILRNETHFVRIHPE